MKKPENYDYLYLMAESRGEPDDLAPARGFLNGLAFGIACWGLLGLAVVIWRVAAR